MNSQADQIERVAKESLNLLNIDAIDLYHQDCVDPDVPTDKLQRDRRVQPLCIQFTITKILHNFELPGSKGASAKLVKLTKSNKKRFLRDILGSIHIPHEAICQIEHPILILHYQFVQGIQITLDCELYRFRRFHVTLPSSLERMPCLFGS